MRKLLVDADVLVYEAAFAAQKTRYHYLSRNFNDADECKVWCETQDPPLPYKEFRKEGKITTSVELLPESAARMILSMKLNNIQQACGSSNVKLILSGDGNYRDDFAKTKPYKGNRNQPKPQHYLFVRDCVLGMGAELTVGIEADDSIGIDMTEDPESVICTIDKDLNCLPGRHYNWGNGLRYKVSESDAHYWFMRQLLTGDGVDNVPGIPGMGEKAAEKLLSPVRGQLGAMFNEVLGAYDKGPFKFKDGSTTPDPRGANKVNTTYLSEQGILLWIQRKPGERWNPNYYVKEYIA